MPANKDISLPLKTRPKATDFLFQKNFDTLDASAFDCNDEINMFQKDSNSVISQKVLLSQKTYVKVL